MVVNLSNLRSSLQKLELRCIAMQPKWFNSVTFTCLKALSLRFDASRLDQLQQIWKLLQRLPELQVNFYGLLLESLG